MSYNASNGELASPLPIGSAAAAERQLDLNSWTPSPGADARLLNATAAAATHDVVGAADNFSGAYVALAFVLFAALLVVGLCGNALVVVIVARMRKMKTPTNCYLVSLAAADCLVLISAPLPGLSDLFVTPGGRWIYGSVLCSLLTFLQYAAVNASSLTIGAFTLERYISICHPMRAQTFSRYARAYKIVAGIWAFSALYCSPWLYLATVSELPLPSGNRTISGCTHRLLRHQYSAIYMVDLIVFYCVPLAGACVLYALIARTLYRRTGSFEECGGGGRALLRANSARPAYIKQMSRASNGSGQCSLEDRRAQIVKMLVVVTLLFAILWMPYRVWVVYNSFMPKERLFGSVWFSLFARTLVFANSAINPLLYSAFSKKFREAFVHYLTCRYLQKPRRQPNGSQRRSPVLNGHGATVSSEVSRRTSNAST